MKTIKTLATRRNTWHDVAVFENRQQAEAQGYGVMYDDDLCNGTIYGKLKPNTVYCWDVGVVFYDR